MKKTSLFLSILAIAGAFAVSCTGGAEQKTESTEVAETASTFKVVQAFKKVLKWVHVLVALSLKLIVMVLYYLKKMAFH